MNNRTEHKNKLINALTEAQKIAFAPFTFHAVGAMLELGILKEIDNDISSALDLEKKLGLSEYAVSTLLEAGETIGVIEINDGNCSLTPLGQAFLYDEMTRVNFNFMKDVCFQGASEMTESFKNGIPYGLKKLYPDGKTIYPYISKLPDKMRKSWYEFDHYYSDNCFDIIYKIIDTNKKIFDIGANTGKFEKVCLKNNPNCDITMIDLKENIEFIKNDKDLAKCKFYPADILTAPLPEISGSVIMSQFLDCFSKEQIELILKRIKEASDKDTKIYILEPFIDRQKFAGAKYALVHTSLYFTCMANGCSKMYSQKTMEEIIEKAGLKINCVYDTLGAHDYTLRECVHA